MVWENWVWHQSLQQALQAPVKIPWTKRSDEKRNVSRTCQTWESDWAYNSVQDPARTPEAWLARVQGDNMTRGFALQSPPPLLSRECQHKHTLPHTKVIHLAPTEAAVCWRHMYGFDNLLTYGKLDRLRATSGHHFNKHWSHYLCSWHEKIITSGCVM